MSAAAVPGNWLRNGNRPGNPANAPRCGAETRSGAACRAPAMPNGRCRMHGGASTGPRTAAGLARLRAAAWIDGRRCRETRVHRAACRATAQRIEALARLAEFCVYEGSRLAAALQQARAVAAGRSNPADFDTTPHATRAAAAEVGPVPAATDVRLQPVDRVGATGSAPASGVPAGPVPAALAPSAFSPSMLAPTADRLALRPMPGVDMRPHATRETVADSWPSIAFGEGWQTARAPPGHSATRRRSAAEERAVLRRAIHQLRFFGPYTSV